MSFGHKFAERCGHADPQLSNDQRAPIFVQFLDAVYQILRQFPLSFEFNEHFLLALCHHVYSCAFGTFLFESEKERSDISLARKTPSVWTWLLDKSRILLFMNPLYRSSSLKLLPNCTAKHIIIWERLHCQNDYVSSGGFCDSIVEASFEHFQKYLLLLFLF